MADATPKLRQVGVALLFILGCQVAGLLGTLFTNTGAGSWYDMLEKPAFNPPGWVFAPVWTTLYALMGLAAYLVWRRGWHRHVVRKALGVFAVQLALNALWTPVFFGLHAIGLAFGVIVLLGLAIVWTMRVFFPWSKAAAWLLVPYLVWVLFAAVLNGSIWLLN